MRSLALLLTLLLLLLPAGVRAQESPSPSPSATAATAIPLADVATEAAAVNAWLQTLDGTLHDDAQMDEVRSGLADSGAELQQQLQEVHALVDEPGPETQRAREARLQSRDNALGELSASFDRWKKILDARAAVLGDQVSRLSQLDEQWNRTAEAARQEAASPVIQQGIGAVREALGQARERVQARQGDLFTLQNNLSDQMARLQEGRDALARARRLMVDRALVQDSPALWDLALSWEGLRTRFRSSLAVQLADLEDYLTHRAARLAGWVAVFGGLLLGMRWIRRRTEPWAQGERELQQAERLFGTPGAAALLLTVVLARNSTLSAPTLFGAFLGAAAVFPAVLVLRRLLDPYLHPLLNALVFFYLADDLRLIASGVPTAARLMLLAETLLAALFLAWFPRPARFASLPEEERAGVQERATLLTRAALAFFGASAVANVLGYVDLATLLGGATLRAAYGLLVVLALTRLLQGLAVVALHVPPLVLSSAVRQNQALLADRCRRVLHVLAMVLGALIVLGAFSIQDQVLGQVAAVLNAKLTLGNLGLSLGGLLTFGLSVWGSVLLSRFLRFLLDEDLYPRLQMARGTSQALSMTLHYAIVLLGVMFAMGAVGVDLTKLTVLAGAVGVGIGFGLQNIVNNFVSGMILLFDPALSPGDSIQFGQHQGELVRVGLRASTVRLLDGRALIVPNSDLINQQVINGTAGEQPPRRMEITFSLAEAEDERRVLELLEEVAAAHPEVVPAPRPLALFLGFERGTPTFQLLTWTADAARTSAVRSELALQIGAALRAAGLQVGGPRQEVRLVAPRDGAG